jgi:hypothetical protein
MTNEGTPLSGEPFVFPSYGNIGPPYIDTLSLPGLTIGLPVWFFSTPVISNASYLDVGTPPTNQPHVNLFPSSPSEISQASSQINKKKKKNQKGMKPPTTSNVGSKQPVTVNNNGSVDKVDKVKMKNLKPKFPCSICKGDHFLRDFPGIPKVLEMWSSTSSAPTGHAGDTPSTSDFKVGKKKTTVKFPFMLCKGDYYSHLCPRMDKDSSLLEKLQPLKGSRRISPNPCLVYGMVNPVPSLVNLVDQVVNIVSSLVAPLTKVSDPVLSSINPNFHLESETEVTDLVSSSISPTFHLEIETQVTDPVLSLISPTLHQKSVKLVAPVTSSVNPTSLTCAKVTDLVPSSISPTLHPKSAKLVSPMTSSVNTTLPMTSSKVVSPVTSSVNTTPPLTSAKVVSPITSSVNTTLPLTSAKVVAPFRSLVSPTLLLKSAKVVDPISSSIDPTLPLESKPDFSHVFLVDTGSTMLGGIPHSPTKTPPSN